MKKISSTENAQEILQNLTKALQAAQQLGLINGVNVLPEQTIQQSCPSTQESTQMNNKTSTERKRI